MHFCKAFPPLGMKVCDNCTCANDNLGMEFKMHMCVGTLHCVFNFHHLTCCGCMIFTVLCLLCPFLLIDEPL
jgi:hypothetical protein